MQRFDSNPEMFCKTDSAINAAHLAFLRWLADQGCLEHPSAGPPSGPLVEPPRPTAWARLHEAWQAGRARLMRRVNRHGPDARTFIEAYCGSRGF
jgi:hypothetical protein